MSDRIVDMRTALLEALVEIGCPPPSSVFPDWKHIIDQIGMFAYTGLEAKHVDILTDKWHIYCTKNGRFSMAGRYTRGFMLRVFSWIAIFTPLFVARRSSFLCRA